MKRHLIGFSAFVALFVSGFVDSSQAASARNVTMLVVPARYSVMQVAFDVAAKYPCILVSYQGDATTEEPLLHAWNGQEWVRVTLPDYAAANFLQVTPGQTVLIGDEQLLPPVLANSIATWCPRVITLPSVNTTDIINSLSKIFNFKSADWAWFAARYNLQLNDVNAPARQKSWYDRPSYEDQYSKKLKGRRAVNPAEPPAIVMPESAPAPVVLPEPAPAPVAEPAAVPVETPAPAPVETPAPAPEVMTEPSAPAAAIAPVDDQFIDSNAQAPLPVAGASEPAADVVPQGDAMMLPVSDAAATPAAPADWQEKATATEPPVK